MPLGQSTVYSYVAPRPRCATEPELTRWGVPVAISGRRDTRRKETSNPGGRSPSKHPRGCCQSGCGDGPCRGRLTCVSPRYRAGWLLARCHARLFSSDIVSGASRRRHLQSHRLLHTRWSPHIAKPAAVAARRNGWSAHGAPYQVSTHTPRSVARRVTGNRVPGPKLPRSRRRRHRRFDLFCSARQRHASKPFRPPPVSWRFATAWVSR